MRKIKMCKRVAYAIAVFCLFNAPAIAGMFSALESAKFHEEKVVWATDHFKSSVVTIIQSRGDNSYETGTGVIIYYESSLLVITNNHIVRDSSACVVGLLSGAGQAKFAFGEVIKSKTYPDLALIRLTADPEKVEAYIKPLINPKDESQISNLTLKVSSQHDLDQFWEKNKALPENVFASVDLIQPGKQLYFLGFPLGYGVQNKNPLFRVGYVASNPENGYFYMDAMVSHGNSGSPAFIEEITEGKNEEVIYSWKFAGIIQGFDADYVEYKSEVNHKILLPHNAGLANVIDIKTIVAFIEN
jgi:hypothetical protein